MRRFVFILFVSLIAQGVQADWIKGDFSPEAGIDSLERILVITDLVDSSNIGVKIVPAGDQNGDGIDDIICIRDQIYSTLDHFGYMFYGGVSPDSIPDKILPRFSKWFNNIGDINNDFIDDFGGLPLPDFRFETFYGGDSMIDTSDTFYFENKIVYMTRIVDIDNDLSKEIILSRFNNGSNVFQVDIFHVDSLIDTIPVYSFHDTATNFGDNVNIGDYNGDGFVDIAISASYNRDTNFVKFYWGGDNFDTTFDFIVKSIEPQFGKHVVSVGDFNGDSYCDFVISGVNNFPSGIYYGGPIFDDQLDVILNHDYLSSGYIGLQSVDYLGDINNDGYDDLITGYSNEAATRRQFFIYLGGPLFDSIPDVTISDDDIPGLNLYMGYEVRGIGDFNGDGIDDFAVHAMNWRDGEVYIFAGWNSNPTDISYDFEPNLPDNFSLSQNYPNPFNPSTTIEFLIPIKQQVTLSIYNTLGQRVRTLLDEELSVGSYSLEWDSKNDGGKDVASGVYLYKLEAGEVVLSKKMVLLW